MICQVSCYLLQASEVPFLRILMNYKGKWTLSNDRKAMFEKLAKSYEFQ